MRNEDQLRSEIRELETALFKKRRALSEIVKDRETQVTKKFIVWQEKKDDQRRLREGEV